MERVFVALNALLFAACLIVATMAVSTACRTRAAAQVAGEVGSIVAMTGPARPTDDQPLFVADTKNQQLMIYEYQPQTDEFCLTSVRHIRYDPFLGYFNRSRTIPSPTPEDVKRLIQQKITR